METDGDDGDTDEEDSHDVTSVGCLEQDSTTIWSPSSPNSEFKNENIARFDNGIKIMEDSESAPPITTPLSVTDETNNTTTSVVTEDDVGNESDPLTNFDATYGSCEDVSCFPMFSCCRRSSRQKDCYSNTSSMFGSQSDMTSQRPLQRPKPYQQDYVKISHTSSVSSSQYSHSSNQTSCSILTASDISSGGRSYVSSNGSSVSMSQDSGCFDDEPPCLLNLVFLDHKCRGFQSCRKTKYRNLNVHLRHLTTCMPQPFSESRESAKYQNLSQKAPYLSRRRHAICETSEEMRALFCEALNSFLTLQAMVKYDFL